MEHHHSAIYGIVNQLLGPLALPLLEALGIHPHDPTHPIPDHIAMEIFILLVAGVFFLWLRGRLSATNPGGLQLCFEKLLSNPFQVGFYDLLDEIAGHGGRKHLAMIGTIGLFILFCNAVSLIPAFTSPTAIQSVPLGCALAVFLYYHYAGLQAHGAGGYAKHFVGHAFAMPKIMQPIMIVAFAIIEGISHLSRLLSLTARLWANMFASELLYLTFLSMTASLFAWAWHLNVVAGGAVLIVPLTSPAMFPILFVGLHALVAFIQAFVFTLLPIVYVGAAVEKEH